MDSMKLATGEAWKGERMYWDIASDDDRHLHLSRYELARELFQSDWDCLDAACGSGYGAAFLVEKTRSVCGIDVNESAIEYARTRYSKPNLTYRCADLQRELPFADESFDAITSFETLEHVKKQEHMLSEFRRVLKRDGILIMSSPDRNVSERIGLDNHFHVAERSKREFVDLLSRSFSVKQVLGHGNGNPVSSHWKAAHRLLKFGSSLVGPNMRSRTERTLARPFGWLRGHFYQMSGSPIQPVTDLDNSTFVYVIAVARRSD
jgi:SAM-dependent methyltransferase